MNSDLYAIIVAGGQGSRMQSSIPKQFMLLDGKPIILHTLERFINFKETIKITLVLPENQLSEWMRICEQYKFNNNLIKVVPGGASRYHSVREGLKTIENDNGIVAIHDGVRPFLKQEIIENCFSKAIETSNAVLSVPLKDSIRKIAKDGISVALNRDEYNLIQTPQVFRVNLIKEAYEITSNENFTDDASVYEYAGFRINLVQGSFENIKITTPEDLTFAEAVLKNFRYL